MRIFVTLFVSLSILAAPASAGHHKSGEHGAAKPNRFATADANGDGVISRDEFMARAAERFEKMDVDGDGSLSKDEMKRPRKSR